MKEQLAATVAGAVFGWEQEIQDEVRNRQKPGCTTPPIPPPSPLPYSSKPQQGIWIFFFSKCHEKPLGVENELGAGASQKAR